MAQPDLHLVRYGRCASCGRTEFLWATSPRSTIKRCLVCATKGKGEFNEQTHPART